MLLPLKTRRKAPPRRPAGEAVGARGARDLCLWQYSGCRPPKARILLGASLSDCMRLTLFQDVILLSTCITAHGVLLSPAVHPLVGACHWSTSRVHPARAPPHPKKFMCGELVFIVCVVRCTWRSQDCLVLGCQLSIEHTIQCAITFIRASKLNSTFENFIQSSK